MDLACMAWHCENRYGSCFPAVWAGASHCRAVLWGEVLKVMSRQMWSPLARGAARGTDSLDPRACVQFKHVLDEIWGNKSAMIGWYVRL